MMNLLKAVRSLNLPDWWICAGFIRSKIWDVIHGFSMRTPLPDVDVIYFDSTNINEIDEKKIEEKLKLIIPNIPWSVKNQARMHVINNMPPYSSSTDGISKFPETVTAIGVKLDDNNRILLAAPWGINDVINLTVKPTPYYQEASERNKIYESRMKNKNWKSTWSRLRVYSRNNSCLGQ
ncbi:nucleotidyltransferase family protein [Bacillus sp. JJ722]|uniref:nucleotidyltransferase family protein n=1 Tax=Bacillus sp. JJ722 TaxID=3122973 RepID=UPI002FFF76E4